MKKIRCFIKEKYYFIFLLFPLIFICFRNTRPDNDIWFLLTNGRYVFGHGIPTIEPFTIHEGFSYIMQQWFSSVALWKIFEMFGSRGILTIVLLLAGVLIYVFYKLCFVISENKKLSVLITCFVMILCCKKIVSRPQLFTYIELIIEMLCLELYIKKDNGKYLIPLVFISLLEINLHSIMWCFLFLVLLPYLLNTIKIKNITIDKIRLKPLIIVTVLMVLIAFINPYGYKNLLIIFNSYGSKIMNSFVTELQPMVINRFDGKLIFITLLLYIGLVNFIKIEKLDIRHFCLFIGFTLLAFLHNKGFPYYCFALGIVLARHLKNLDIDKIETIFGGKIINVWKVLIYCLCGLVIVSTIFTVCLTYKTYKWSTYSSYPEAYEAIKEGFKLEDVRLYTTFNDGGYFEFKDIKVYIDPRAEVFTKQFNHMEDILEEYYDLNNSKDFDFENFLEKYSFTHLFVPADSNFYDYLTKRNDYEIIYEKYVDKEKTQLLKCLFVYKG